jgi:hypothetical protein
MDQDFWGSREPDRLKWLRVPTQTGSDVVLGPNVLSHLSFTWCQNPCLPRFPMHLIE